MTYIYAGEFYDTLEETFEQTHNRKGVKKHREWMTGFSLHITLSVQFKPVLVICLGNKNRCSWVSEDTCQPVDKRMLVRR